MDYLDKLTGKKILRIFMNGEYLQFVTDEGTLTLTVEGDCCSHSFFHDFLGVKKLLENGPVKKVSDIDLDHTVSDAEKEDLENGELKVYGYSITTEDPNFGEVTSVFSFRNSSNGYYGGSMELCDNREVQPEITDDVFETAPSA